MEELDQLDAALCTWRKAVNARTAQITAELAALSLLLEDKPPSHYERCLFCDAEYGLNDSRTNYDMITAACGCNGVGWKCAAANHPQDDDFKCFGCNSLNQKPFPKCYKCRRPLQHQHLRRAQKLCAVKLLLLLYARRVTVRLPGRATNAIIWHLAPWETQLRPHGTFPLRHFLIPRRFADAALTPI